MPRYGKEWKQRMNRGDRNWEEPKKEEKKQKTLDDFTEEKND
jgi:hypothetical protein